MQLHGKQTDWQAVRKSSDLPIITIITSTFNAGKDLPWTINSIKNQTYPNIQWIVADGGSNDDTVKLLQDNSDVIDVWFSEPDAGIYDAWNKALEYVQGDWVQFLGAGDELYENTTLEQVAEYLNGAYPEYEIAYGKVSHISEKGRKELYISGEPWENYQGKWQGNRPALPCHQGIFHHQNIFKKLKFDTRFKIIADMHLLLQCLNKDFLYLPQIISYMPIGGVSSTPIGGVKMSEEIALSTKLLKIKPPPKIVMLSSLRYRFTKTALKFLTEQQYGQLIDFTKTIRRKPKVFTVE